MQKGTFTITNPGVFGSIDRHADHQPAAGGDPGVGSIEKQPAVMTVDGTDTIGIRTKGMLSLAFDHRMVDGADADRFMADVKKTLQEFPEGGGVAWVARSPCRGCGSPGAARPSTCAVLAELEALGRGARAAPLGVPAAGNDPELFLEFSESGAVRAPPRRRFGRRAEAALEARLREPAARVRRRLSVVRAAPAGRRH